MAQRLPQLEHAELHAVIRAVRATAERTHASQAISEPSLATALLLFAVISLGFLHGALLRAWTPSPASVPPAKENDMKAIGVMAMAAVLGSGALAQDAVQWRVEDGGNGHWYIIKVVDVSIRLAQARQIALAHGGDLASIATHSEYMFVTPLLLGAVDSDGCHPAVYQGLTQLPGQPWKWMDGTPFKWSVWGDESDPMYPQGKFGMFSPGGFEPYCVPHLLWDDGPIDAIHPLHRGVFIEWSADCNSDGIVDYGQIRTGELDDANSNNIPDCCEQGIVCDCPADIDRSGAVNGVDLSIILNAWGVGGGKYPEADVNGDGTVDAVDLSFVLNAWGPCP